jgi:hypothetical protein
MPAELSSKEAFCFFIVELRPAEMRLKEEAAGAFIVGPRPPELRPKEAVLRLSSAL